MGVKISFINLIILVFLQGSYFITVASMNDEIDSNESKFFLSLSSNDSSYNSTEVENKNSDDIESNFNQNQFNDEIQRDDNEQISESKNSSEDNNSTMDETHNESEEKNSSTNANESPNEFPYDCKPVYAPVCAFNKRCFKTFNNLCEMLKEHHNLPEYNHFNVKHKDVCEDIELPNCDSCTQGCTKDYRPVCGYNSLCFQTFVNECEMHRRNCNGGHNRTFKIYGQGECTNDHSPGCKFCPEICFETYLPICAKKGECYANFSNECYMDRANCLLREDDVYEIEHDGECIPEEETKLCA